MPLIKKILLDCAKMCSLAYLSQEDLQCKFQENRPYEKNEECRVFYKCKGECPTLICSKCPDPENEEIEGNNDCQVYTTRYENSNKNTLMVAFRGTESGRDVLTDLNIFTSRLELPKYSIYHYPLFHQEEIRDNWNVNIRVHSGFNNQFLAVRDELENCIDEFMNQHYLENPIWGQIYVNGENENKNLKKQDKTQSIPSIIFTGHSLGGALATLSSLYFKCKYPEAEVSCITFGSPRAGSKEFTRLFNNNIEESYRFVNDNDPVPCVPLAWRFKHVKGCQWLYQDKVMNEISVNRLWRFIKNTVLNLFGLGGYNAVGDHSCSGYIYDLQHLGYHEEEEEEA
tara:strand:+ start:661 stop:1683 length:1023 start_codon:yes stop_codon:yes gene_type:complete